MASDLQTHPEPSVTSLVSGIVNDFQELLKQQMALFKSEVREDLRQTREVAVSLAAGLGLALLGVVLLCLMLVHLLHWATNNQLPLWGCYGIVGGVLAAVGAALLYAGKKRAETVNPLPEQSVQAMRENVQWIMNPK